MKLYELYQRNPRKEKLGNKVADTLDSIEHEGYTPVTVLAKQNLEKVKSAPNTAGYSDVRGVGRQL